MKLHPTTLLIVAMFGSFAIILTVMIVIFRPKQSPPRRRVEPAVVRPEVRDTVQVADAVGALTETKQDVVASTQQMPVKQPKTVPKTAEASRQLYDQLAREKQEMVQLRSDMEKRLKVALADQNKKLAQLARRMEPLEAGEAVQVLVALSDDDIAGVLRHMQPEKVAPIVVLLKRLGRDGAVGKMK